MSYARAMLGTYPREFGLDTGRLAATIDALSACAQACTACADDCLSEQNVADLVKCIHVCPDCADVCTATLRMLSRQTGYDANLTRPQLQARVAACTSGGTNAGARPDARALPGLRSGLPPLRAGLQPAARGHGLSLTRWHGARPPHGGRGGAGRPAGLQTGCRTLTAWAERPSWRATSGSWTPAANNSAARSRRAWSGSRPCRAAGGERRLACRRSSPAEQPSTDSVRASRNPTPKAPSRSRAPRR
jgi:hypothetical protein